MTPFANGNSYFFFSRFSFSWVGEGSISHQLVNKDQESVRKNNERPLFLAWTRLIFLKDSISKRGILGNTSGCMLEKRIFNHLYYNT